MRGEGRGVNSLDFRPLASNGFKLEVMEWDRGCWLEEIEATLFILTVCGRIFTVVQWTVWTKVYKYQKEGTPSGV